jgi:DNA replication and repair protein RecF
VYVRHLSVADFRSWTRADVDFDPGPSVLVGANGQGKTNLVEAVGYLATLGSHRVATDAPLVRAGAERTVVAAAVVSEGRELQVEVEIHPGRANRARLNRGTVPRPRDILGVLRLVLFAPEDLAIVRGDPSERRRFLDDVLVQRTPRMAGVRADYDRVLKQRAALLKTAGHARRAGSAGDLRTLDVWDDHLAAHGSALLAARLDLLDELREPITAAYRLIAPTSDPIMLRYQSALPEDALAARSGPVVGSGGGSGAGSSNGDGASAVSGRRDEAVLAAAMRAELARVRPQEIERGVTLVGPHRDDLVMSLGELPLRGYASHGESWSAALALRLGSYELLRSDGVEPVLVLDDVFAELDGSRRDQLAGVAAGAEQVLITAAVADDVPAALLGARYDVYDGAVRRVR